MSRLLIVRAKLGEAEVTVTVDVTVEQSYPDILDDMSAAVDRVMGELGRIAATVGVPTPLSKVAVMQAMVAGHAAQQPPSEV